jgi:hypothetical protein
MPMTVVQSIVKNVPVKLLLGIINPEATDEKETHFYDY